MINLWKLTYTSILISLQWLIICVIVQRRVFAKESSKNVRAYKYRKFKIILIIYSLNLLNDIHIII